MNIANIPMGGFGGNCYVVSNGGVAAVIDPGEESFALSHFAESTELQIKYILLTHGHFDHIGGVKFRKERFPLAEVCIGAEDAGMLESETLSLAARFGISHPTLSADRKLREGDVLALGDVEIKVFHTPGHTQGGVVYLAENVAFTGDTLFCGSIGRCDFPGSDIGQMNASLKRLCGLNADTILYPGHGEATTLSRELKFNPFLREEI